LKAQDKYLEYQDYRFSVAPMMDWSESASFSSLSARICSARQIPKLFRGSWLSSSLAEDNATPGLWAGDFSHRPLFSGGLMLVGDVQPHRVISPMLLRNANFRFRPKPEMPSEQRNVCFRVDKRTRALRVGRIGTYPV